jgi:S1-C subfamily serine protease
LLPQTGLQKGDIILAVRDQTIEEVQGYTNLINSVPQHWKVVLPALDHRSVARKPLKSP